MQITWTTSAAEMPPDDFADVIVSAYSCFISPQGGDLKAWVSIDQVKWAEFTTEKWEHLNK